MIYTIGSYVVYGANEICRINEKVMKCFDGKNEFEYFSLTPLNTLHSTYYVPVDGMEKKVRPLLTKDEIYAVIDAIPDTSDSWLSDKHERKNHFESVLKSDDFIQMIAMMKAICNERDKKVSNGKRSCVADERAFTTAEKIINQEFSFVLGIDEDEVADFIKRRLEQNAASSVKD